LEHRPIKMPNEAPSEIRIKYERSRTTGLLRGYSDDLPGLQAYARTREDLNAELVELASAFASEIFGAEIRYYIPDEADSDNEPTDEFEPLADAKLELEPA
jgi:hypothetical protein